MQHDLDTTSVLTINRFLSMLIILLLFLSDILQIFNLFLKIQVGAQSYLILQIIHDLLQQIQVFQPYPYDQK